MTKPRYLGIILIFFHIHCFAQDSVFVRHIIDTLTTPYFWGRGYTNDGLDKASGFISNQFSQYGLQPLQSKNYFQNFSLSVNTFPGKMELMINGFHLEPGKDFIISPESRGVKGKFVLYQKDSTHFIDTVNKVSIVLVNKLTWSVRQRMDDYTTIYINASSCKSLPLEVTLNIENTFINDFKTANICGYVKGTAQPDSFILITAHYDHLGGMGRDTYFPGANDNASGVALLLNLASYYAKNPQLYSICFICFSAEEAGLVGSRYFTEHPLVALKNIRFLLNLDLEGNGEEGITVVNATEYPAEFQWMQQLNRKHNYFTAIHSRGKAANSDHYYFTEKKVPSFFFYTLGGSKAYHDIFDRSETLSLSKINHLIKFIKDFNTLLMSPNNR